MDDRHPAGPATGRSDVGRIIARRKRQDALFNVLGVVCTLVGVVTLLALLTDLAADGLRRIDGQFLTSFPSRFASRAGILSAWVGTLLIMLVTAATAVPLGVAAGVYLEEYARKNWLTSIIEINISNLAGVPSIIYGLMALGLFVYQLHLGRSVLTGGLTLACLILPIVIVATREALRSIPQNMREAAFALGATRWQVVRHHLLPYSTGGIATGIIIGLSRAIGETAPLVTIGALTFVALHRRHHQHSDRPEDPHSPHQGGPGLLGVLRGLWHAHLGWIFRPDPPDLRRYVKDLLRDGSLRVASALFPLWVAAGLLIPAALGGLLTGRWTGALLGLLWGGLARIFPVHHVTWSVNSVCHLWGRQPFPSHDHSRNNFLFGIFALGEGWHNNHHAFPTSARHGLRWWQIDVSWWVIRALALLGLAWNVRLPAKQALPASC